MNHTLQDSYSFQGLPIAVETPAGELRQGTDPNGEDWSIEMKHDYGYIRGGATGADMEALDVYIGPDRKAEFAYVIKQHKIEEVEKWETENCPACDSHVHQCACPQYYDEDKVMLGFSSEEAAKIAYLEHYDNIRFLGPIVTVPIEEFKSLVRGVTGYVHFSNAVMDAVGSKYVRGRRILKQWMDKCERMTEEELSAIDHPDSKENRIHFFLHPIPKDVSQKLGMIRPAYLYQDKIYISARRVAHLYLRKPSIARKLLESMIKDKSMFKDAHVFVNREKRTGDASIVTRDQYLNVSKGKHVAVVLNVGIEDRVLSITAMPQPTRGLKKYAEEVLLDSLEGQQRPARAGHSPHNSCPETGYPRADFLELSETNKTTISLILDGVNLELEEVLLPKGTGKVLDESLYGAMMVPNRDFIGTASFVGSFKDLKNAFISMLSEADALEARASGFIRKIKAGGSLKSLSGAIRFLQGDGKKFYEKAKYQDDFLEALKQAFEEVEAKSEASVFEDGEAVANKVDLLKKEVEARELQAGLEVLLASKDQAPLGQVIEAEKKIDAVGTELINDIFSLSPIDDREAKAWARMIEISPAAKNVISKHYSMTKFRKDVQDFFKLCHGQLPMARFITEPRLERSSADPETYSVKVGKDVDRAMVFHELTHLLERNPRYKAAAQSFLQRRAKKSGESKPTPLKELFPKASYRPEELAFQDNFYDAYQGKVYGDGYSEIFTMYTQEMSDPRRAARLLKADPEGFKFMLGLLAGQAPEEKEAVDESRRRFVIAQKYRDELKAYWDGFTLTSEGEHKKYPNGEAFIFVSDDGVTIEVGRVKISGSWQSFIRQRGDRAESMPDGLAQLIAAEILLYRKKNFSQKSIDRSFDNLSEPLYSHGAFSPSNGPLLGSI